MPAEVEHLGRIARIEQRHVQVAEDPGRRRRQRRALRGGVVADERDGAAAPTGAGVHGVTHRVGGAVDARGLAVPDAEDAVVAVVGLRGRELRAHHRGGRVLLVHRRSAHDRQVGRELRGLADGDVEAADFGFPNSYGTLGYALKLTMRTQPVRKFVQVEHNRFSAAGDCFAAIGRLVADPDIDFLDGVVFAPDEMVVSVGRFVDEAPYVSDYSFERIYYRSLRERSTDFLTTEGYLWRWDTDWFWCSKNVGAQHPLLRRLYGRRRLNSVTYQRIMRWNSRWGLTRALNRVRGVHAESVIQDVDIPIDRAAEFLAFLHAEVGILPIWLCPIRAPDAAVAFTLYPLSPGTMYVNFGFWDVVTTREQRPAGFCNRVIERKVRELGGIKSLYSDSYFTEDEFWEIYNRPAYAALKERYDPAGALGDLYAKTVLRA